MSPVLLRGRRVLSARAVYQQWLLQFLSHSAVCPLVCSYSCCLVKSGYLLWRFSPNQQQYHYGKLLSVRQAFLFCTFAVVFRMNWFCTAFFLHSSSCPLKKEEKEGLLVTFSQQDGRMWPLPGFEIELACWRHLYMLSHYMVVVRLTPTCLVQISVHANCAVCQLPLALEYGRELQK